MAEPTEPEPLIDPDCRDGKHGSCVGGPCECMCHGPAPERTPPDATTENLRGRIAWLRDRWYQRPGLSEQADALDAALDEFADDTTAPVTARLAQAEAERDHAEGQLSALRAHETRWETEKARADKAERKLHQVAMVRVWTNEDGKRFVFADDLAAALLPAPESPAAATVTS